MSSADEWQLLARSSPAGLALATNRRHRLPRHLELLDEKLLDVAAGRTRRLLVFMPPRHGKSEEVSRYFPAWYLGTFPAKRVILASYEADFAATWGRKARDLLEEHGEPIFGVQVDQGSKARNRWDLADHLGGMVTAGVAGPITGKGADCLIIDDPIKNAEQAQSPTIREKQKDWYRSTASPRLEPDGAVVIVVTRWHQDDLAGWLLQEAEEGGDAWEVVSLPALAEKDDPLGREPGVALWPDRFDADTLAQIARRGGSYWFAAMYQQRPQPLEGGLFQRADFRYWSDAGEETYVLHDSDGMRVIPKGKCRRFQTIDVADSESKMADYTVVSTWALTRDRDLLLIGRARERFEGTELPRLVLGEVAEHDPAVIKVERNMYGRGLIKRLVQKGLPVQPLTADTDKVTRALSAAAVYEQHKVFHPRGVPWLREWEDELASFPNSAHDDQVDTVSYAARAIAEMAVSAYRQKESGTTHTGGMRSRRF